MGEPFTESLYTGGRAYLFDAITGGSLKVMSYPQSTGDALFGHAVDIQYNKYYSEATGTIHDLCRLHVGPPVLTWRVWPAREPYSPMKQRLF